MVIVKETIDLHLLIQTRQELILGYMLYLFSLYKMVRATKYTYS